MSRIVCPALRLIIAPAAVAAVAGFELWPAGALAAISVSWCVLVVCVLATGAWGRLQLERTRRRLRSRRDHRATRAR